jgi:hypothetical protein
MILVPLFDLKFLARSLRVDVELQIGGTSAVDPLARSDECPPVSQVKGARHG